mgnify:FL=1
MPRGEEVYNITEARKSASIDRDARTRRYLISMTIRTVCFLAAILVDGWLTWVLFAAAVVLPYIAVVGASTIIRPPSPVSMPPLIIKDTQEFPVGHPDRTV